MEVKEYIKYSKTMKHEDYNMKVQNHAYLNFLKTTV